MSSDKKRLRNIQMVKVIHANRCKHSSQKHTHHFNNIYMCVCVCVDKLSSNVQIYNFIPGIACRLVAA